VRAPRHELAELELRYLQDIGSKRVDHPTSGPVQTSDLADCLFNLVHRLIGPDIHAQLSAVQPHVVAGPGSSVYPPHSYGEQFSTAGQAHRYLRRYRYR
jgi:hypothetical protein